MVSRSTSTRTEVSASEHSPSATAGTVGCAVGCRISGVGEAATTVGIGAATAASAVGATEAATGTGSSPPVKLRTRTIKVTKAASPNIRRRRQ